MYTIKYLVRYLTLGCQIEMCMYGTLVSIGRARIARVNREKNREKKTYKKQNKKYNKPCVFPEFQ